MLDIDNQLARLKQRVAAIDQKYAHAASSAQRGSDPASRLQSARCFIEEWSEGQVVVNEFGQHFQTERLFASHKQHGSADIGALSELPENLLDVLSENEIGNTSPFRWAFLDTETTGLAGGSGTYAFLIGVGRITAEGFRVRQFFMREYVEERSMLAAFEQHLNDFDVLITYNGKSYDQPLLETRYRMKRQQAAVWPPQPSGSAVWRAAALEVAAGELPADAAGAANLGVLARRRSPGELIPYVYFEYLRSREAAARSSYFSSQCHRYSDAGLSYRRLFPLHFGAPTRTLL